ncbi:hypothetical protein THIOKS12630023 [Thiocapsa sp. KS1]|nr:hypothetical protein THIOKS12630023 [Thiocapsa sp. KS1]
MSCGYLHFRVLLLSTADAVEPFPIPDQTHVHRRERPHDRHRRARRRPNQAPWPCRPIPADGTRRYGRVGVCRLRQRTEDDDGRAESRRQGRREEITTQAGAAQQRTGDPRVPDRTRRITGRA